MTTDDKIAALRQQLGALEGASGTSEIEAWRNETKGVLRGIFSINHPSIEELNQIRFVGPMGIDMLNAGRSEAAGLVRGLIHEIELSSG